jgi:hypothetical protein
MTYIYPSATKSISDNFAAHIKRGSGLPGVDFLCRIGDKTWATEDGVVTRAERSSVSGLNVRIHHADGRNTYHLHLSRIDVALGQRVSKGQVIGLTGNTGRSTGPHLHFSMTNSNGTLIDPLTVLGKGSGGSVTGRRTVKLGSHGDDVRYLQRKLGIPADGIFGPLTRRAVINFQKSRLLAADGIVGPRTWGAIG